MELKKIDCVFFNDTTSQLNWGCHATTYFTKELLKKNNFNIKYNITLHESLDEKKLNKFIENIILSKIKYVFVNGEGSLYEQTNLKGKKMIVFIKKIINKDVKIYLINSGFDLYKKESIEMFKGILKRNLQIQLREPISIKNFKKYYQKDVIFQPDYLLRVSEEYYLDKKILKKFSLIEKDYIVIGGNSNYYRNDRPPYNAIEKYIKMINLIKEVWNKKIIIYASSQEEINWLSNISKKTNCLLISVKTTNWKEALIILGSAYLSISGRYHPTLMSLQKGVPCMMFSANHCKMNGINKMFELPWDVIESHEIHNNYEKIINFIKEMLDEKIYKKYNKHLLDKYKKLKDLCILNLN